MKYLEKVWRARNWMKRNESFLKTWHAYVGYEMNLFKQFERAKTVQEVALESGVHEDLLQCWVEVGSSIKHLRTRPNNRYRTSRKHCAEFLTTDGNEVGALLKEMMELHMPTLLAYPHYMRSNDRAHFNHEKYGDVVAQTSSLLEKFAVRRIIKMVKEKKVTRIIDIGCGYGGYLRKLADAFPHIEMIGVDVNEQVVDYANEAAKEYDNITFIVGDASSWTPETDKADLILLHNLFHYLEPTSRTQLIDHLSTWLEEEGIISVITPVNEAEFGRAFSSAFNSFFTAHSNLYALPKQREIESMAKTSGLYLSNLDPIVREGGWYAFWLSPNTVTN